MWWMWWSCHVTHWVGPHCPTRQGVGAHLTLRDWWGLVFFLGFYPSLCRWLADYCVRHGHGGHRGRSRASQVWLTGVILWWWATKPQVVDRGCSLILVMWVVQCCHGGRVGMWHARRLMVQGHGWREGWVVRGMEFINPPAWYGTFSLQDVAVFCGTETLSRNPLRQNL